MVLSLRFSFSVFMITSNHISGKAIDMTIKWSGSIKVKKKNKTEVQVTYSANANTNTVLHSIGD